MPPNFYRWPWTDQGRHRGWPAPRIFTQTIVSQKYRLLGGSAPPPPIRNGCLLCLCSGRWNHLFSNRRLGSWSLSSACSTHLAGSAILLSSHNGFCRGRAYPHRRRPPPPHSPPFATLSRWRLSYASRHALPTSPPQFWTRGCLRSLRRTTFANSEVTLAGRYARPWVQAFRIPPCALGPYSQASQRTKPYGPSYSAHCPHRGCRPLLLHRTLHPSWQREFEAPSPDSSQWLCRRFAGCSRLTGSKLPSYALWFLSHHPLQTAFPALQPC